MRAIIGGILLGLTAVHPALAIVLWHLTLWAAATTGTVTGWALHQPAAVIALAVATGLRRLSRTGRRRAA